VHDETKRSRHEGDSHLRHWQAHWALWQSVHLRWTAFIRRMVIPTAVLRSVEIEELDVKGLRVGDLMVNKWLAVLWE